MRHLSDANARNLKAELFVKRPERQRGDWSFLTWAFFLPHLVATEVFFGKGAKAADQDGGAHGVATSDLATDTAPSSDSPLNLVSAKEPDDVDARQPEGSASSSSQTALSNLQIDAPQSGPSALSPVSNDEEKTASGGGGGGESVSFDGYTLTTDGAVSASSGSAHLDSSTIYAAIAPDQSDENSLPQSIINGSGEIPESQRNGLNPTESSETDGSPHGSNPVSSLTGPGHAPNLFGNSDVGFATSVHPTDITTPTPDISPGLGAVMDVKGLLGFDLQLNGDGLSLSAELSTGPLSDLLGFDLRVTTDGIFAGLNLGAPLLTPIVAGISEGVESVLHATSSELGSILSLDGQLGSALLPELLGGNSGLSITGGGSQSQPIKDLLTDVTGVHVLGGLESSQLISKIVDAAGAPVNMVVSGQNEASQVAALSSHIVSEVLQIAGLTENGIISSGDAFHFATEAHQQTDALFAGQQYTDYNVTLQSNSAVGATIGGLVSDIGGHAAETVSSIMHPVENVILQQNPTDNHQEAAQHDEQLNASSLLNTALSVVHLTSH